MPVPQMRSAVQQRLCLELKHVSPGPSQHALPQTCDGLQHLSSAVVQTVPGWQQMSGPEQ